MSQILGLISKVFVNIDKSEFDDNGHLNNAAYPRCFEFGRRDLIKLSGWEASTLRQRGIAFWMRDHSYTHKKPIVKEPFVKILSKFCDYEGRMRIGIYQKMLSDGEIFATSSSEYFFFSLKDERPIMPPDWIVSRF